MSEASRKPPGDLVTGIILAGGRSRRMGFNKALLTIRGRPLIQVVHQRMAAVTDEVIVSSNEPDPYAFLRSPVVPDLYPGQGPLAGLHAAMMHSARPLLLLVACDLPGVQENLLRLLISRASGFDAVVPRTSDGRIHPACAVYRRTLLGDIDHFLASGVNKIARLLEARPGRVRWLNTQDEGIDDRVLDNLNTPEDLERVLRNDPDPQHIVPCSSDDHDI